MWRPLLRAFTILHVRVESLRQLFNRALQEIKSAGIRSQSTDVGERGVLDIIGIDAQISSDYVGSSQAFSSKGRLLTQATT